MNGLHPLPGFAILCRADEVHDGQREDCPYLREIPGVANVLERSEIGRQKDYHAKPRDRVLSTRSQQDNAQSQQAIKPKPRARDAATDAEHRAEIWIAFKQSNKDNRQFRRHPRIAHPRQIAHAQGIRIPRKVTCNVHHLNIWIERHRRVERRSILNPSREKRRCSDKDDNDAYSEQRAPISSAPVEERRRHEHENGTERNPCWL